MNPKLETDDCQDTHGSKVDFLNLGGNGDGTQDAPPQVAASPDPFDPERQRISQDFGAGLGVKRMILKVPVRKPSPEWWIQVHPDEAYRTEIGVLELKEGDRETYLVDAPLRTHLQSEKTFGWRSLRTAINRQNTVFLWPIRLPGPDGRIDDWSVSAMEAAQIAVGNWVRITANMNRGAYDVDTTEAELPVPQWPDLQFRNLFELAFKKRFIGSLDHPVLQRLRGEI